METHGIFSPSTLDEARDQYELVGPAAQTVVRETAKAMAFSREEYANRVTPSVVETARDALFASLLTVQTGPRAEYDSHVESTAYDTIELGSDHVQYVAWHTAPIANTIIAATYQSEPDAAIATLRRQAYGRLYRDHLDRTAEH